MSKPVTLSCDASQSGLGYVLMQDGEPVAYGSKALTDAEYAYAQIEKELLAIVCGLKKFHTYIYGKADVTIETDHAPLLQILEKPLHQVPLRLQKMRMKLQGYDFKLVVKKGTEIPVADALSRSYLQETEPQMEVFTVSTEENINVQQVRPQRLEEIRRKTAEDKELQALMKILASSRGWPETKSEVDPLVSPYFHVRGDLNAIDGIVYKGQRIVIPRVMRTEALDILHKSHQGIVRTKQLARDLLFWPGLNAAIEDKVSRCSACQEHRSYQAREPMVETPVPTGPWEHVGQDLFDCLGSKWLITTDYFSEYFEIDKLDDSTGGTVIEKTKKIFSTHGIPDIVTTDNGPPFNSFEYQNFAETYKFSHVTSSPRYPQGNANAERAVGIAKNLLIKCEETREDPYLALLNLRNTPKDEVTGSPVQRLYNRRTRTLIPTAQCRLKPEPTNIVAVRGKLGERRQRSKKYYNRGTRHLGPLQKGEEVRVRTGKTWTPARLVSQDDCPRSYNVQMPSGRVWRRNRRDLLKTKEHDIFVPNPNLDIDMNYEPMVQPPPATPAKTIPNSTPLSLSPQTPRPSTPRTPRATPARSPTVTSPSLSPSSTVVTTPRTTRQTDPKTPVVLDKPVCPIDKPTVTPQVITRSGRHSRPPVKFRDYV